MNVDEKRRLENKLMVMGLNGLEDPELVPIFAAICNMHPGYTDGNEFLMGLINECDQEKRYAMYEALKPHLTFKVWPLDLFVRKLKQHAQNVESRDQPIEIGKKLYKETAAQFADMAFVELTCYKCKRINGFIDKTMVGAMIKAREKGWVRDLANNKECCPPCKATRTDA